VGKGSDVVWVVAAWTVRRHRLLRLRFASTVQDVAMATRYSMLNSSRAVPSAFCATQVLQSRSKAKRGCKIAPVWISASLSTNGVQ